jgi:lipoate-protein ligase A
MKLYDLGHVPWIQSQLIYHAMPRLGMEGILYVAPATPYVCIGYHQDVEQDIDLDFCQAQGIPVFRREIGGGGVYLDGEQIFYTTLTRYFEPVTGLLEPSQLSAEVYAEAERLKSRLTSDEWLYKGGKHVRGREVKIAGGVNVVHKVHKAPGGLIRGVSETKDGRIISTSISGDFFFYPAEKLATLEKALIGVKLNEVESTIAGFYQAEGIESPDVTPADLARVIAGD